MKEIGHYLDGPPKNNELDSYVVSFEFSRPKVAQQQDQEYPIKQTCQVMTK